MVRSIGIMGYTAAVNVILQRRPTAEVIHCSVRGPLPRHPHCERSEPGSARAARDRPGQGAAGRAAGREVRRPLQRRYADARGPRLGLQAAHPGGAGLAAAQERPPDPAALPLGAPPHLRPRVLEHGGVAPGAPRGERLRRHVANIRDDLWQIKLAQLSTPHGELWQVTDPLPAAANRLKQLKIPPPPPVLKIDPPPTHTAPRA